jgi:hypothetical protein
MIDQVLESMRRASESSMQVQQELLKQWTQQWMAAPGAVAGAPREWGQGIQRRWVELMVEAMNRHRESLDSVYRAGIQALEEGFRVSEARSPEDYRRMTEELWRKTFDAFKEQSDTQLRNFQSLAEKSFNIAQSNAS